MAGGKVSEEEEVEEAALAVESPKQKELGVDPRQAEPDMGVEAVVSDPAEMAANAEDLARD